MPTLYLTTPGTRAHLTRQHLEVEFPEKPADSAPASPISASTVLRRIALHDIEQVVVETTTALTLAALAAFAERKIPVVIVRPNGQAVALCLPPAPDLPTRLAHYQSRLTAGFSLAIARSLVEAKIANSRRLLQRLASNREQPAPTAVHRLENHRTASLTATSVESCRGYEGTSAGTYFEALATFFPASTPFERRSRRPPHNPANALLSFGYSLLTHETTTALHAAGLDPALGYLHEPETGRPSLALDLIEPFRAPVADGLALDLLNHGTLQPQTHFEPREGGIYLNQEGRRRFYTGYERRMDRPFTSDLTGERTTLRDEIRRQLYSLKRLLLQQGAFEPFIMN
ncbi:MAG: CRISPR-associated endonuclease Cas1 [Verrucomicrobiota bacterium]|jgi:CRISPR-associated protein Cas1